MLAWASVRCLLWVSRVGLTSCPSRPLYPEHRTFPDAVGISHLWPGTDMI